MPHPKHNHNDSCPIFSVPIPLNYSCSIARSCMTEKYCNTHKVLFYYVNEAYEHRLLKNPGFFLKTMGLPPTVMDTSPIIFVSEKPYQPSNHVRSVPSSIPEPPFCSCRRLPSAVVPSKEETGHKIRRPGNVIPLPKANRRGRESVHRIFRVQQ